jgi:Ca2+-binding EF-hand superfamily protein
MTRRTQNAVTGLALLAGLLAGGCSSVGNPFEKSNDMDRTFIGAAQTWDTDKNGVVTCDEWARYVATSVRENDANGDGALDANEWGNLVKADRLFQVAGLAYYDANGDGRVTAEEMSGKQNLAFKLLDRNQDCQIDRTESVQVMSPDAPAKSSGSGTSEGQGPAGRGAGGPGGM